MNSQAAPLRTSGIDLANVFPTVGGEPAEGAMKVDSVGLPIHLKQATPEAFLGGDERTPLTGRPLFFEATARLSERMHSLTLAALEHLEQAGTPVRTC